MVGIIMIVLNVLYVCRVSVFLEPSEECVRYSRNTSTPDVPTHTYTKYIACQGVGHVTIWFSASCWSFPYTVYRKEKLFCWLRILGHMIQVDTDWWFGFLYQQVSISYLLWKYKFKKCNTSFHFTWVWLTRRKHGHSGAEIFCTEKPKRCSLSALFEHCLRLRFEISYKRKQIRVK